LSLATVVAPTALSLIGCTILRAVSGILRTQCGRRGSGPRETICNRAVALLPPSWLDLRPCGSSIALRLSSRSRGSFAAPAAWLSPLWLNCRRPCGLALAPVAQLPSPLWLGSRPCGSTAVCLGSSLPCQIKPGPSYAAADIGVQRGAGLSWRDGVWLLARCALYFSWAPVAQLTAPVARLPHTWPAVCLGSSLPCQIKPGPSYAAAVFGVQRGAGLSWRDGVWLPARRALYFSWAASGG
jgi:hypothetical protein